MRAWAFVILFLSVTAPALAWDPIKDLTGKRLDQHMQNLADSFDKFRRKPIRYPLERAGEVLMDVCAAPQLSYVKVLHKQAEGRWKLLPENFIAAAQAFFSTDLRGVYYAENVRTLNGAAQTFGSDIFFPRKIDFGARNDVHWMLHELEHVVQYARRGRQSALLCEYTAKWAGKGFKDRHIDMERAADRKADQTIGNVFASLHGKRLLPGYIKRQPPRVAENGDLCVLRKGNTAYSEVVSMGPVGSPCQLRGRGGEVLQGNRIAR